MMHARNQCIMKINLVERICTRVFMHTKKADSFFPLKCYLASKSWDSARELVSLFKCKHGFDLQSKKIVLLVREGLIT